MHSLRNVYARKGLCQIPRLLSSQDRNRFSPTYGCMNREYWLCRSTDFPNSIAQFGVHALALAWNHSMPDNPYYRHPKVLEWTLAGMEYWTRIQHRDGTFDEFYPNERGWAGPTGFLLYVMCDTWHLLQNEIPAELKEPLMKAIHRAGLALSRTDEAGVLANHHAMAILPMYEAYVLTQDKRILDSFHNKLDEFFSYCHEEGWCLEYDGVDPGYLSATISFMAKLRRHYEDERFMPFFERAVEFSSYFVYPNGHYGGTAGSRQTLHFYPHGYELLTKEIPLAGVVADRMLRGLRDGALVPPEIQGERYFVYRIPELLLSYRDYGERVDSDACLPYEREPSQQYFDGAKVWVDIREGSYTVVNAAKGGVVKHFDLSDGRLMINNCGIWGKLEGGTLITSQWIDNDLAVTRDENLLRIEGQCHKVPTKLFTPLKFIVFRVVMLAIGWNERLAYHMKGLIRNLLMLGARPAPVRFVREIHLTTDTVSVTTEVHLKGDAQMTHLQIGDEFPARYVPQSRYFQPQELDVRGLVLDSEALKRLNRERKLVAEERWWTDQARSEIRLKDTRNS